MRKAKRNLDVLSLLQEVGGLSDVTFGSDLLALFFFPLQLFLLDLLLQVIGFHASDEQLLNIVVLLESGMETRAVHVTYPFLAFVDDAEQVGALNVGFGVRNKFELARLTLQAIDLVLLLSKQLDLTDAFKIGFVFHLHAIQKL